MKQLTFLILCLGLYFAGQASSLPKTRFSPEVRKQIESKFLVGDAPIRYYSNILIRIDGNPCPEDVKVVTDLVVSLSNLIPTWDVSLIREGTSNLIIEINRPGNEGKGNDIIENFNSAEIVQNRIILNLYEKPGSVERKKVIYYYLMRSLAVFKRNIPEPREKIAGYVFDEENPQNISFHPLDHKVIGALYVTEFDHLKKNISGPSDRKYNLTGGSINLMSILFALVFLIAMAQAGYFKSHHYRFILFFRQGLLVCIAWMIYVFFVVTLSYAYNWFTNRPPVFLGVTFTRLLTGWTSLLISNLILVILIYLIERPILKNRNSNLFLQVLIPFITTSLISTLFTCLLNFLPGTGTSDYRLNVSVYTLVFCTTIGLARSFYIYLSIQSRNMVRSKDLELARLNELHKQAQLQSLQSKINPHFLYNSLNSIAGLAATNPAKTEKMALALSDFFRYSLNKEQKTLVLLKEEVESIETYLTIEKMRFGDRLNYAVLLPQELEERLVPQFMIQPLVENAVKHGISKLSTGGEVRVEISGTPDVTEIRVFDNGPDFPDELISGYGMQSIQEKLNLICQDKGYLKWENGPRKHILVVLPRLKPEGNEPNCL